MPQKLSIFFAISGTCALAFAGLGLAGCSGGDPGVEGLTRAVWDASSPTGDGGPRPDGGGGDGGGGSDGGGGTDSGPVDAGVNAFTGAGAFGGTAPGTSAVQQHTNGMVGTTPGRGAACLNMGCHGAGTGGREFLFAGTIFADVAGTMPAVNAEVRVRGMDGMGFKTNSDANGNFWLLKGANVLALPALTGARNAQSQTSLMVGTIGGGNCNAMGCHGNGATVMHVP